MQRLKEARNRLINSQQNFICGANRNEHEISHDIQTFTWKKLQQK